MIRRSILSVNLNKIALLRNARDSARPGLLEMAQAAIDCGAVGVTAHPRADERHIRLDDVVALSAMPSIRAGQAEFNVEGDLRDELVRLITEIRPTQFTIVPVMPGERTSSRGWRAYDNHTRLAEVARSLRPAVRVAVFVDPDPMSIDRVARAGIDAIEIFTGGYASCARGATEPEALKQIVAAAQHARRLGLRVHGGHGLDLGNLAALVRAVSFDELSIGHYLTCDAIKIGWTRAVRSYIDCIRQGGVPIPPTDSPAPAPKDL